MSLLGTRPPVDDVTPLAAVRWGVPESIGLSVDVPPAGVYVGTDRSGAPAMLRAVAARPIRIGMLGNGPAPLLAYRLLAVGCLVTVVTAQSPQWHGLATRVNSPRLTLVDRPVQWPPTPAGSPWSRSGPQAMIIDGPAVPPRWLGDAPWCTVIHVTTQIPAGSEFWASVDTMLVSQPGYGPAVAHRFGRSDAAVADDLRRGEIAVADAGGTRAVALAVAPGEREAISGR